MNHRKQCRYMFGIGILLTEDTFGEVERAFDTTQRESA
jgi:hypothetical protein